MMFSGFLKNFINVLKSPSGMTWKPRFLKDKLEEYHRRRLSGYLLSHLYARFLEDTQDEGASDFFEAKYDVSNPRRAFDALESVINHILERMDKGGYRYSDLLRKYSTIFIYQELYRPNSPYLRVVK